MKKVKVIAASGVLVLSLAGYIAVTIDGNTTESITPASTPPAVIAEVSANEITSVVMQERDFTPTEEDVISARAEALAGMSDEQIERLNLVVREANLWWEHMYLYFNIFETLEDPNALYWNCFEQTGEIQIGWAVDGELDKNTVCEQEGITEDEFYAKYGTKVVSDNKHTVDDFVAILDELIATVQNEDLKADLQYVRDEAWLAKENHSMEHANNEYKMLHDLDYFLLRYGPVDVGQYVEDDSTVSKYYGTLSIYA